MSSLCRLTPPLFPRGAHCHVAVGLWFYLSSLRAEAHKHEAAKQKRTRARARAPELAPGAERATVLPADVSSA